MEALKALWPCIFIIILCQANSLLADLTTDDCAALGFNKASLLCSVCDQLPQFKLEDLK